MSAALLMQLSALLASWSSCQAFWQLNVLFTGSASQQTDGGTAKSRKRSLEEHKATDAPGTTEDEQHSSQSAFQQYRPQPNQLAAHQAQQAAHTSKSQALQLLLSAARTQEGVHPGSFSHQHHTEVNGPSQPSVISGQIPVGHTLKSAVANRVDCPNHLVSGKMQGQPWPSMLTLRSTVSMPLQSVMDTASQVDAMYAQTKPKAKISAQLVKDIQRLELPEMEADSVQAALEFAEAVKVTQHAQQASNSMHPSYAAQHSADHAKLLHTLEVGTGRLDVLRILTHRIRSSTSNDFSNVTGGPVQLLEVVQDLLKDMETRQRLLHHAEQAVLAHRQSALQRVDTLQAHHAATREYWLQSQRLQRISNERQALLQRMMM